MVDHVYNSHNIGFIIQARMQSTRLPKKVLLPLPIKSGKPMIRWITDQLQTSKLNAKIIVATSTNSADDSLETYCLQHSINYYRGDEFNVLNRFISLAKIYNFDHVVRFTGDNPLIDTKILDHVVLYHIYNNFDYTKSTGLPLGMNIEVIKGKALLSLKTKEISDYDKEHVTNFFGKTDEYSNGVVNYNKIRGMDSLRLTVDYPSDYTFMSTLLSLYNEHNKKAGIEFVKFVYKKFPWLFMSNITNYQRRNCNSLLQEISDAKKILCNHGFDKSAVLLEKFFYHQKNIHT